MKKLLFVFAFVAFVAIFGGCTQNQKQILVKPSSGCEMASESKIKNSTTYDLIKLEGYHEAYGGESTDVNVALLRVHCKTKDKNSGDICIQYTVYKTESEAGNDWYIEHDQRNVFTENIEKVSICDWEGEFGYADLEGVGKHGAIGQLGMKSEGFFHQFSVSYTEKGKSGDAKNLLDEDRVIAKQDAIQLAKCYCQNKNLFPIESER